MKEGAIRSCHPADVTCSSPLSLTARCIWAWLITLMGGPSSSALVEKQEPGWMKVPGGMTVAVGMPVGGTSQRACSSSSSQISVTPALPGVSLLTIALPAAEESKKISKFMVT